MREFAGATSIGEEAEVSNAPKALGQNVQEKAAHELIGIEGHRLGFVASATVFPPKAHGSVGAIEETAVGDRDEMRGTAVIVENLLRAPPNGLLA